jgi:hypothetical protein
MSESLSPKARLALSILVDHGPLRPASFARKMWPKSEGWERYSNCGPNGARTGMGVEMAGGAFLGKLRKRGLVKLVAEMYGHSYKISAEGRKALRGSK